MIRLVISDDNLHFVKALYNYIQAKNINNINIINICTDGNETLNVIRTLEPDVVILDLQMPNKNRTRCFRRII